MRTDPAAVTIDVGPCKRHAQNGLTAAADGLDGLCAGCRSTITAGAERRNTYNGSRPLHADPLPKAPNLKGGTPPDSTVRKAARVARFRTAITRLTAGDVRRASPAAVREAGIAVGVGERTAREYHRELKRGGMS